MPGAGRLAGARVSMASFVNRKTWTPAFAGVTSEYGNRLRGPQSHALANARRKIERHPHPIPPPSRRRAKKEEALLIVPAPLLGAGQGGGCRTKKGPAVAGPEFHCAARVSALLIYLPASRP